MADIITGPGRYLAEWKGEQIVIGVTGRARSGNWRTDVTEAEPDYCYICYGDGSPFGGGPRIISRIDEPEAQPGPANEPEWKPGDECVPYHKDGDAGPFPPYWLIGIMSDGRFVTEDRDGDLATWPRIERPAKRREWRWGLTERNYIENFSRIPVVCDGIITAEEEDDAKRIILAALNAAEAK